MPIIYTYVYLLYIPLMYAYVPIYVYIPTSPTNLPTYLDTYHRYMRWPACLPSYLDGVLGHHLETIGGVARNVERVRKHGQAVLFRELLFQAGTAHDLHLKDIYDMNMAKEYREYRFFINIYYLY